MKEDTGKTRSSRKTRHVTRTHALIHLRWFLSKNEIFPSFVAMQNASRKSVWLSSRKKMKTFLTLETSI